MIDSIPIGSVNECMFDTVHVQRWQRDRSPFQSIRTKNYDALPHVRSLYPTTTDTATSLGMVGGIQHHPCYCDCDIQVAIQPTSTI